MIKFIGGSALRFTEWGILRTLRHRNFRLYVGGQLISLAGTWMQNVAQGWLVYQLSRSEFTLGMVGFASAIPALLISPWGGVLVDRFSKRKLMVMTQIGAMSLALILSLLTFVGWIQVWHIVLMAVCLGAINAIDGPARQAFVVEMVGREDLPNAIALNSITFNIGRVLGPAIGGALLVSLGAAWCFLVNGLSFLAVIASLLAMALLPHTAQLHHTSPWQELKSGLSYVRDQPTIRALLLLSLILSLFGIAYVALLPAVVDKMLNRGAATYSTLNTAIGIGAMTSVLLLTNYGERVGRGRWLSFLALFFPLMLGIFAFTRNYQLAILLAALLGAGFIGEYVLLNTLLQTQIQDVMRGRVLSLYTLTFFGFTPFGNLAVGALAEWINLSTAIALCAATTLILSGLVLYSAPALHRLR
jgi:MFS family permease